MLKERGILEQATIATRYGVILALASPYEGLLHYRIWTHSAKRGVIYWGDAYVLTIQKGELFIGDIAHVEIEDHNKQALIQVLDQAFATYDYLIYKKQALT